MKADRIAAGILWSLAALVVLVFAGILGSILFQGFSGLSLNFLVTAPEDGGRAGGIGPVLQSTALLLLVCMAVALPIGIGCAAFLTEYVHAESKFGRIVSRSLDVLAGVPSIVFGLFGSVFFCQVLGMGFSIAAGGLTLACMVLPLLIRSTEEGLRALPFDYRQTSAALGISRGTMLFRLLIPAALPSLAAGFLLGISRAAAETAALLFTSGYVDRWPESIWDSGRSLTVHIYDLAMNVPGGNAHAHTSTLVLISSLLVINIFATWISRRGSLHPSTSR